MSLKVIGRGEAGISDCNEEQGPFFSKQQGQPFHVQED